jgi:16S rRNA (adenine1518-N6/adenine1519-N6)-dimethyltransferase
VPPPRRRGTRRPLGQHFLDDTRILEGIADAVAPAAGDVVLEIGPGRGALTVALLRRGARVVAIERDPRLARDCGLRIADCGFGDRFTILVADALRTDWRAVNPQSAIPNPQWKVTGNIPYYITSPLIDKALTPPLPERVVFLVQAEVGDRLAAAPGTKTYGALSVGVQAVCRVERLFRVAPGAFRPPPRVASAVVRLTPLAAPVIEPSEAVAFRRLVTACFSQRRKQLRNALAAALGVAPDVAAAGLRAVGIDPASRAEQVGPAGFAGLLRWARRL